jgi:hypothetical protein
VKVSIYHSSIGLNICSKMSLVMITLLLTNDNYDNITYITIIFTASLKQ